MTTRQLLIAFFSIYAVLLPFAAWDFFHTSLAASIAIMGSSAIIALLFWTGRVMFLNILLAVYVFQNYLLRPYISIFNDRLSATDLEYIEALNSYYTPQSAGVVYWSLFSLLLAWLIGLTMFRARLNMGRTSIPGLFVSLDRAFFMAGPPLFVSFGLLLVLNFQAPNVGLRAAATQESAGGLFLWGMASLATINVVFLYTFIRTRTSRSRIANYFWLMLPISSVMLSALAGSRGAVYSFFVLGVIYWAALNIDKRWRIRTLTKAILIGIILAPTALVIALFAQPLRTLFRSSRFVDSSDIYRALDYKSVLLDKENLFFGLSELLTRVGQQKAQFYILNDWYIHAPSEYFNLITNVMRTANDLYPGTLFPDLFTINQLFDYVYFNTFLSYNSQMWSIQGTLYLYFDHFLAPIVVLILAIVAVRLYSPIAASVLSSPSLAAFVALLVFDVIANGTLERVLVVDIVRPIISFVIFLSLYKILSLVLPTRLRRKQKERRPRGPSIRTESDGAGAS